MPFVIEDEESAAPKPPNYSPAKKQRFIVEEEPFEGLKRKTKIAAGKFAEGVSDPLSILRSITSPGTSIKENKEKFKNFFESIGLDAPEAESKAEEYISEISKGTGSAAPFGPIAAGVSGLTSAGGKALKEELGVPEGIADIAEIGAGFLSPSGLSKSGKVSTGLEKSAKVIQKEGLAPVRGITKKHFDKITPVTSESSLKNFEKKIEKSVQDASERILEEALLGKQLEKKGTIIGDLIEDSYDQAASIGKTITKKADLSRASTIIGRNADKIEKSAPSLSGPTEEVVKKLRKYQRDFSSSRISPEQFQNQWKEINKDLANLYRKPELTGSEKLLRSSLEETKDVLMKEASRQFKNPAYTNSFKQANKLFSEAAKMEKANALFEPIWDKGFNANRFRGVFQSPKKYNELVQSVGPENAKRLRDISKYYVDPIEKLKSKFKTKNLLDLEEVIGSATIFKLLGPLAGAGKIVSVDLPRRVQAKLMMSENTQSIWLRLMKSIQHGSPKLIQKYVEELENDLSSED